MTFGRVAEALPRAVRLVGWPKLVIFFFFFFFFISTARAGVRQRKKLECIMRLVIAAS